MVERGNSRSPYKYNVGHQCESNVRQEQIIKQVQTVTQIFNMSESPARVQRQIKKIQIKVQNRKQPLRVPLF